MLGGIDGVSPATNLTFSNVKAGSYLPICVSRIASSTTCTGVLLF